MPCIGASSTGGLIATPCVGPTRRSISGDSPVRRSAFGVRRPCACGYM